MKPPFKIGDYLKVDPTASLFVLQPYFKTVPNGFMPNEEQLLEETFEVIDIQPYDGNRSKYLVKIDGRCRLNVITEAVAGGFDTNYFIKLEDPVDILEEF